MSHGGPPALACLRAVEARGPEKCRRWACHPHPRPRGAGDSKSTWSCRIQVGGCRAQPPSTQHCPANHSHFPCAAAQSNGEPNTDCLRGFEQGGSSDWYPASRLRSPEVYQAPVLGNLLGTMSLGHDYKPPLVIIKMKPGAVESFCAVGMSSMDTQSREG
ncbi:hypothetical protein BU16DRAFT_522927 [Lophium mytilinum]|uniref:Uncharacterized protein n=1 Tax=Lophium mytilinum TaxID=390894 RepID=A0A6A6R6Q9_9PEZI|nr:hypothetical protein BU16DRAFT_522927 [Lophium mytilinum]